MSSGRKSARGVLRFVPRAEFLEDRSVPAGNVSVSVSDGVLLIQGDDAANQIFVQGVGDSTISVQSLDGTTINGQSQGGIFANVDSYRIDMFGGADLVQMDNLRGDGSLVANMGDGNDVFLINNAEHHGMTFITGGSGNDSLVLGSSTFRNFMAIDTGVGEDQVITFLSGAMRVAMVNPSGNDFFDNQGSAFVTFAQAGFTNAPRPIDNTPPTPTLSSSATSTTKDQPIAFAVSFDEDVVGFDATDLLVTGGTVTSFTQQDARNYKFEVTAGDGVVTAMIAAGAATDIAGNASVASNTISRTFDGTKPTLTINSQTTTDTTPTITGTVSESNATVVVTVNGQNITATVSGNTWSATVTSPLSNGTFSVSATATDPAGNKSDTVTNASAIVIDANSPTVTFSAAPGQITNASPFTITITFSEPVTGFEASDISVINGVKGAFQTVTPGTVFTIVITPTTQGAVTINVPEDVATDPAGNGNEQSSITVTFETTPPTGTVAATGKTTITGTSADPSPASGVQKVEVSVKNAAGMFLTSAGTFTSATEVFLPAAAATANFATWSLAIATEGTFTVRAKITDRASNETIITQTVIIDNTPPLVGIDNTPTVAHAVTGTSSDANAGTTVQVSVRDPNTQKFLNAAGTAFDSDTEVFLNATPTSGTTFDTWSLAIFMDGTYLVVAKATDVAGNVTTAPQESVTVS
jgi:hypothetical protein